MSENYEEIYLEPKSEDYGLEGRMWCDDDVWDSDDYGGEKAVKYVRSDIVDIKIGILSDRVSELESMLSLGVGLTKNNYCDTP